MGSTVCVLSTQGCVNPPEHRHSRIAGTQKHSCPPLCLSLSSQRLGYTGRWNAANAMLQSLLKGKRAVKVARLPLRRAGNTHDEEQYTDDKKGGVRARERPKTMCAQQMRPSVTLAGLS